MSPTSEPGARCAQIHRLVIGMFAVAACCLTVSLRSAVADDGAKKSEQFKAYTEAIPNTPVSFEMVPIPGGKFTMGSPPDEEDRLEDEGPQHEVKIEPFWMGKYEVRWDEYDIYSFNLDIQRRKLLNIEPTESELRADAITRPTKPYVDMTFGMGHDGYPAICMTQLAAKMYCVWLTEKTGHYYRLPTEAEWEYACRAGTTTAYSFGDDVDQLDEYAWHYENSEDAYHKVGEKKPNPWGLYDMHGNVSEWVLDQYDENFYAKTLKSGTAFPVNVPTKLYPRVVRGGSWDDDPDRLRSAARIQSTPDWKIQDPQLPQSIWFHTDAIFVGFRVVRPMTVPDDETRKKLQLDAVLPKGYDPATGKVNAVDE